MKLSLLALAAVCAVVLGAAPSATAADKLVVDISNNKVAITTAFAGTDLLLFGATDREGDVVTIVRGPRESEVVRRKGISAGIWINKDAVTYDNVPTYYAIASTKPIADILSPEARRAHEIGIDVVSVQPEKPTADEAEFRKALERIKRRTGLFREETRPIQLRGNRLFRADVRLPANVPVGHYTVSVYLVRDGQVVDVQHAPLNVAKVGFEAAVYDYAHTSSILYGVLAIIVATAAGWLANMVFRRA